MATGGSVLVFYDAGCGFCRSSAVFLAKRDRRGVSLKFAPLDGPTFRSVVPRNSGARSLGSLVVVDGGVVTMKSGAVITALSAVGGFWGFAARLASLVPERIRDRIYDAVARRRHRIAGGAENCTVLPRSVRARFTEEPPEERDS